jgi:hypothetical protein
MARSDWLGEPPNACIDFRLCAGRDYHSRCRRSPVLVLLGFPSAATLDVERHGTAAGPLVALARAAASALRGQGRKRAGVERATKARVFRLSR